MKRLAITLLLLIATASTADAQSVEYTIVDLGTLGGNSQQSAAVAINASGQIAGTATDPTTGEIGNAFFYAGNGAPLQDLGTLDGQIGTVSSAAGINSSGWVVGESNSGAETLGFLWRGSGAASRSAWGGSESSAYGINDAGTVCGASLTASGTAYIGFVYKNGLMTSTGTLIGGAINDIGQMGAVVDTNSTGGLAGYFVNSNGQATNIGSFGGTYTAPFAINQEGELAGFSNTVLGYPNAFVYSNGLLKDLGTLDGMNSSYAYGLNDYGDVVGESVQGGLGELGFIWTPSGGMQNLNDLIPPDSGWTIDAAEGINDNGQIAGTGAIDGEEHAFLLDPVPEPSTAALLAAIGLAAAIRCNPDVAGRKLNR